MDQSEASTDFMRWRDLWPAMEPIKKHVREWKDEEDIHARTHLRYPLNFAVFLRYVEVFLRHTLKFKPIYVYARPLHPPLLAYDVKNLNVI